MNDIETLLESACDDAELASDLLELFSGQFHNGMNVLVDAARNNNAREAEFIAHKLVGSAVACGFVELAKKLRSVEIHCMKEIPDDLEEKTEGLTRLLVEGCREMRVRLRGMEQYEESGHS